MVLKRYSLFCVYIECMVYADTEYYNTTEIKNCIDTGMTVYIKKALHRAAVQYPYGAWTSCLWHTNYPGIRPPGSGGAGNQPCVGEPLVPYTAFLLRPPLLNAIVAENFLLRKHYLKCISMVSLSVVWKTS